MNDFLPSTYEVPGSTGGYMKLEAGENKIRVLDNPILGFEWWVDAHGNIRQAGERPKQGNKPVRVGMDGKVPVEAAETYKHFWAMPVWNYKEKRVQILQLTQKTIQRMIKSLTRNKDWLDPKKYDLSIIREGEGLDTEYNVVPMPPEPIDDKIVKQYEEMEINMEALYEGGNPFEKVDSSQRLTDKDIDKADHELRNPQT